MKIPKSCLVGVIAVAICHAFAGPAGNWKCVATSSNGDKLAITLEVKNDGGKLSGGVVFESGDRVAMIEPKINEGQLTFKVSISGGEYQVSLKIDGSKLSGKYSGAEASGTIEGEKAS